MARVAVPVISLSEKHEKSRFWNPLFSTPYNQPYKMTTSRRPLGPISGNIIKRKELTLFKRGQIIGASLAGLDNPTIAASLTTPESTVRSTLCYNSHRLNGETARRIGRPQTWNDHHVRRLVRLVRAQPNSPIKRSAKS